MRKPLRSVAPFLPALALMALIFAFSGLPSDGDEKGLLVLVARKAAHFGEYFLLTALWWWALRTKMSSRRALLPALAIAIGYAITDEIHQTFVDGRVGTWRDVAIDSAGALAAAWLIARSRARSLARR
ncbi:MAG: VanZ family protein [Thermoleophilaceae bacterium]